MKYWVDYRGSVKVEANNREEAEKKFWEEADLSTTEYVEIETIELIEE